MMNTTVGRPESMMPRHPPRARSSTGLAQHDAPHAGVARLAVAGIRVVGIVEQAGGQSLGMQVTQFLHRIHRIGEVDPRRVGEVLTGSGCHATDLAEPPRAVSGCLGQPVGTCLVFCS